jgi:hypothetical protein
MLNGLENVSVEPVWVFLLGAMGVLALGFVADSQNAARDVAPLEARAEAAIAAQATRTKRTPTAEEAKDLRESFIDTEALVGEAKELGLDHDDHIVRRRLAHKRRALLRTQRPPVPSSAEESAALMVTRHSLHHIFLAHSADDETGAARLGAAQDALVSGQAWDTLGDPFIRGQRFSALDDSDVRRTFGAGFADTLPGLEIGAWSPVQSTYGVHLVYVDGRTSDAVEADPVREARSAATEAVRRGERALLEALRSEFPIHREAAPMEQP